MAVLEELKRRKLVQWGLAYLAGAWVALQLVAILAGQFAWPRWIQQGTTILLAFGFLVALVVAWYHGEKGRQRVSGPEVLMVAALLLTAGVAIAVVRGGPETDAAGAGAARTGDARAGSGLPTLAGDSIPERSVAVLPLDDHSPDGDDAYFAAAMTEEITSALSNVPELRVSARNSAAQFRRSGRTVGEFALEELRVAHALEGSVQLQDDRARITVQLIDARTEDHDWSETYAVELDDVLDVQVDIARQVADRLATTFTRNHRERIVAGATDDPVAHEWYLRASDLGMGTDAEGEERIGLLRRAVRRDPEFSVAWAELGTSFFFRRLASGEDRWMDSIGSAFDRAIRTAGHPSLRTRFAAKRRLMLGEGREEAIPLLTEAARSYPSDPILLMDLSNAYWYAGDLAAAAAWVQKALALDPLDVARHVRLASFYLPLGLDERVQDVLARARELDPERASPVRGLAALHRLNGNRERAAALVDTLHAMGDPEAPLEDGLVRLWAGDEEGAYRAFRRYPEEDLDRRPGYVPEIAYTARALGDTALATRLADRIRENYGELPHDPVVTSLLLQIVAARGDTEASVRALERYIEAGGREDARTIRLSPLFSRAREDSSFVALLSRLEIMVERQRRRLERELERSDG